MMRAIHCVYDDKFIDGAISLFETDKRIQNDYFLFCPKNCINKPFKYIKSEYVKRACFDDCVNLLNNYDVVFLHSWYSVDARQLLRIKENIKIVWFSWGWDYYNKFVVSDNLYAPITKSYLAKTWNLYRLKEIVVNFKRSIRYIGFDKILKRLNYFSGVFPYEYDLLKSRWPQLAAKPVDFYYGSTHFFVPENVDDNITNSFDNIIIGNSNGPENNHLDVFDYLSKANLSFSGNVIIPLSYGANQEYKKYVEEKAKEIWKDKVRVLDRYLPLDEYTEIVSNCKVAIFFHERQQASDNVLMQLLHGAKVFMSDNSLMFHYLKSLGFNIFCLQKDLEEINQPLSYQQILENRYILSKNFSSIALINRVNVIVSIILKDCESIP